MIISIKVWLSLTAFHWYGLYPIRLGGTHNTRSTVYYSNWLMLSFGQLRLSRPQLYTNMHAKKQRQEVEDSCLNFYPDCPFFLSTLKQTATKMVGDKKPNDVFHDLQRCDILLIHMWRSSDFILPFTGEVRAQGQLQNRDLISIWERMPVSTGAWTEVIQLKDSLAFYTDI